MYTKLRLVELNVNHSVIGGGVVTCLCLLVPGPIPHLAGPMHSGLEYTHN